MEKADSRTMVLSVRYPYADLLLSGAKRTELRRKFNEDIRPGTKVLIYASGTTKAVIGECQIYKITKLSVNQLWKEHAINSMISWEDYRDYFKGTDYGYAVEMIKPRRYPLPIELSEIFPDKEKPRPPQSYCFLHAS